MDRGERSRRAVGTFEMGIFFPRAREEKARVKKFICLNTKCFGESNSLLHFVNIYSGGHAEKICKRQLCKRHRGAPPPDREIQGKFPGFQKCEPSAKTAPRAPLGVRDGKSGPRSFHRAFEWIAGGILGERLALLRWHKKW